MQKIDEYFQQTITSKILKHWMNLLRGEGDWFLEPKLEGDGANFLAA